MNVPAFIAIPIRALFFTIALIAFGIFAAVFWTVAAASWWWHQVKG